MRRNRPSRSAMQVAFAVAFLHADEALAPLLPRGLGSLNERLLLTSGRWKRRHVRRMRKPWFRRLVHLVESFGEPGQVLHVGVRKRLADDEARAALAAGCRQVLVIGGGLDTLALRLAGDFPGRTVVEVDHPASQKLKRAALDGLTGGPGGTPPDLHLLPVDLAAATLDGALAALAAWDRTAPTFVLVEGVLMYLRREQVAALLRQLHEVCGPGSRLLFSALRRDARGKMLLGRHPRIAAASFAAGGEPLRWAPAPDELPALVAASGWRVEVERFDLRARYLAPAGLGERRLGAVEHYSLALWS